MDALLNRREPSAWDTFIRSPPLFVAQKLYTFLQKQRLAQSNATHLVKDEDGLDRIRVVCISDTHNQHQSINPLPEGDILIHAGDLTQSGTQEELEQVLKWLSNRPHAYKLFIAGNHDAALADPGVVAHVRGTYPSLIYVQNSETTLDVRGRVLKVYGSPYTPRLGSWPFQYPRIRPSEVLSLSQSSVQTQWSTIPSHTDILITHGPPAYHLDNAGAGCFALLQALWRVRPRLHVFGHIHSARGVEHLSWTADQKAYEKVCVKRKGWRGYWDLLVFIWTAGVASASMLLRRSIGWKGVIAKSTGTTLVNAAVMGGYRDELRRGAIVIEI